jgi:D-ribitol-5-phosphate cytidylyltransferase
MNIAIIFAGGVGQRMGSSIPKQFLTVYGKPIIIHTLEKFQYNENIDLIYVACKEDLIPVFEEMVLKYQITKIPKGGIVAGGKTGQDSIYNALTAAAKENPSDSIVLIHDGVRPIITDDVINANIENVIEKGSAITCTPCFETPVISYDGQSVAELPKRKYVYTAQAPQSFRLGDVLKIHEKVRKENPEYLDIVDTCTLMRTNGYDVSIVEGNRGNIKVTTPEDYIDLLARLSAEDQKEIFNLLNARENDKKLSLKNGEKR